MITEIMVHHGETQPYHISYPGCFAADSDCLLQRSIYLYNTARKPITGWCENPTYDVM